MQFTMVLMLCLGTLTRPPKAYIKKQRDSQACTSIHHMYQSCTFIFTKPDLVLSSFPSGASEKFLEEANKTVLV